MNEEKTSHSNRILKTDNWAKNSTHKLTGTQTIEGNIPDGTTIKITDGDLIIHGNLGHDVRLENKMGNIEFESAATGCEIKAPKGHVNFGTIGLGAHDLEDLELAFRPSQINAASIEGFFANSHTTLEALNGDISLEYGRNYLRLEALKGNITFYRIGAECSVEAGRTLRFKTAGDYSKLQGALVEQERPDGTVTVLMDTGKETPELLVSKAGLCGKINPEPLGAGVYWNKTANVYYVEYPPTKQKKKADQFTELQDNLQAAGAEWDTVSHNKKICCEIHAPRTDAGGATARKIKTIMDKYIAQDRDVEKKI